MNTRRLYYEDRYRTEFCARVLSCEAQNDRFAVVLDETCFYPEGGGQPADLGTLGGAKVLDVHERGGIIEHLTDAALPVGQPITGTIDWPRRFSLMQHHTAEHIVSGFMHKLYKLDNVGFHMGGAMVTIDFNGELDAGQIETVELLANRAVFANAAVCESHPDAEALQALSYRSKKALIGDVRIIEVSGADCCACCGMHVARTGEIGLIKLLSPQRHKGGVRVGLVCGERALLDYREKDNSTAQISALLSLPQNRTPDGVVRLLAEQEALRAALFAAKEKLFALRCAAVGGGSEPLCLFEENLSPAELRQFCLMLCERREGICAVFSDEKENGCRYALGSRSGDMRALSKQMHAALGGRGGGSTELVQGSVSAPRGAAEDFFSSL